ncbi:nitroreductase family protein [bacterium]|nr:nitroreductase family protein [bacterium]
MGILEIIKKRRSIRKFKPDPISEEVLDKLVEALIWAPSAGDL